MIFVLHLYNFQILETVLATSVHRAVSALGLFLSGCIREKHKPLKESKPELGALLKSAVLLDGMVLLSEMASGMAPACSQSPETGHLLNQLGCGQSIMTSLGVLVSVWPLQGDGFWVWGAGGAGSMPVGWSHHIAVRLSHSLMSLVFRGLTYVLTHLVCPVSYASHKDSSS